MLEKLFSSKTRIEILATFFLDPDKSLYTREIERRTGCDLKSISLELTRLRDIDLLHSYRQGNLKYYKLNKSFLIYDELKSIFLKTRGAVAVIQGAISKTEGIEFAFIYGSYASDMENRQSDVDVMVIGNIPLEKLLKLVRKPEGLLAKDVNPSLYDMSEFKMRLQKEDPFITGVVRGPKIILIGNEDELRRAVE